MAVPGFRHPKRATDWKQRLTPKGARRAHHPQKFDYFNASRRGLLPYYALGSGRQHRASILSHAIYQNLQDEACSYTGRAQFIQPITQHKHPPYRGSAKRRGTPSTPHRQNMQDYAKEPSTPTRPDFLCPKDADMRRYAKRKSSPEAQIASPCRTTPP